MPESKPHSGRDEALSYARRVYRNNPPSAFVDEWTVVNMARTLLELEEQLDAALNHLEWAVAKWRNTAIGDYGVKLREVEEFLASVRPSNPAKSQEDE